MAVKRYVAYQSHDFVTLKMFYITKYFVEV